VALTQPCYMYIYVHIDMTSCRFFIFLPLVLWTCFSYSCIHVYADHCKVIVPSNLLYVTWSDKIGLITYFKASRNNSFKYSVCWNLPLAVATSIHSTHIPYLQTIHCTSSEQQSFLPFWIAFYSVLTVSGELQYEGWWGLEAGKTMVSKNERGKCMDALGHSGMGVYSTSQGCTATHSHLKAGQDSVYIPDHLYGLPLCFRKAARKSRPLYDNL